MKPLTLIAMALGTAILLTGGILRRNTHFTVIHTAYTANFDSDNCDVLMKQITAIEVQRNQLSVSLNSLQVAIAFWVVIGLCCGAFHSQSFVLTHNECVLRWTSLCLFVLS